MSGILAKAAAAVSSAVTSATNNKNKPTPASKSIKSTPAAYSYTPDVASSRPQSSVQSLTDITSPISTLPLPTVFTAPIRNDIVHIVHTSMNKNARQPYAVSPGAGHQHSAESWGTGRAVARVPRVSGGGTGRAGQGAFANQCRKGRMFAPTKTWRKWHRKLNVNTKRYAVASALAASALPSLVLARGHQIDSTPEIPLVIDSSVESVNKTKQAVKILQTLGAYQDVERAINGRTLRAGKGKMRNRRYIERRGPLIVYNTDNGIVQGFRNIPGVELTHVDSLSLLQLAPGGHLGRFIIWSEAAYQRLNSTWGTNKSTATEVRVGYHLPRSIMSNSDLSRIIDSDEIQSVLRPTIKQHRINRIHGNPLRNKSLKNQLNPYADTLRTSERQAHERNTANRRAVIDAVRSGKKPSLTKEQQAKKTASNKRHHQKQQNYQRLVDDKKYTGYEQTKSEIAADVAKAEADAAPTKK